MSSTNRRSFVAKAKLESQLEMTRTQEMINGGQMNDVMKRVSIDVFISFQNSIELIFCCCRIQFSINLHNWKVSNRNISLEQSNSIVNKKIINIHHPNRIPLNKMEQQQQQLHQHPHQHNIKIHRFIRHIRTNRHLQCQCIPTIRQLE